MEEIRNEVEETVEVKVEDKKSLIEGIKGIGKKGLDFVKDKAAYCKEHPDEAFNAAVTTAGVVGAVLLTAAGVKEKHKIERSVYSEEIGESVELKKKLNNNDLVELDHRMKYDNQTKIEALRSMGKVK